MLALSSTTNALRVSGDAGDRVDLVDAGWEPGVTIQVIGVSEYLPYLHGAAGLLVEAGMLLRPLPTRQRCDAVRR